MKHLIETRTEKQIENRAINEQISGLNTRDTIECKISSNRPQIFNFLVCSESNKKSDIIQIDYCVKTTNMLKSVVCGSVSTQHH